MIIFFPFQVDHSRIIRSRVLDALETACIPGQPEGEIDRLLSFCVVGGGPAGVEYAGELQDFLTKDVPHSYPEIADRCTVKIIEGLPHILGRFTKESIMYAEQQMKESGVELVTDHFVKEVKAGELTLSHRLTKEVSKVPYGVLVWVTGIAARPLVKDLIATIGKDAGQTFRHGLVVDEHLKVKGTSNVFAMGDCASRGKLPPTAQVASQEGKYLGRSFNAVAEALHTKHSGKIPTEEKDALVAKLGEQDAFDAILEPFDYSHRGAMAYVGGAKAIADFPAVGQEVNDTSAHHSVAGSLTYWVWRSVYMSKLLSFRNRVSVGMDWAKTWAFGRDTSRHE